MVIKVPVTAGFDYIGKARVWIAFHYGLVVGEAVLCPGGAFVVGEGG